MTASYNLSQLGSNYLQGGSGSVARTTASKLQESVSVKDFGAVGDGTTDDTAAIQAAITAAWKSGKRLYAPAGTYLISSTLNIPPGGGYEYRADSFTLYGDGASNGFLSYTLGHGTTFITSTDIPILTYTNYTSNGNNLFIEKIRFQQNNSSATQPVLYFQIFMGLSKIQDCEVYQSGIGDGIKMDYAYSGTISDTIVMNRDLVSSPGTRVGTGLSISTGAGAGGLMKLMRVSSRGWLNAYSVGYTSNSGLSARIEQCESSTVTNGILLNTGLIKTVVDNCYFEGVTGTCIQDQGQATTVSNSFFFGGYTLGIDGTYNANYGSVYFANDFFLSGANSTCIAVYSAGDALGYEKTINSNYIYFNVSGGSIANAIGITLTGNNPCVNIVNNTFRPRRSWVGGSGTIKILDSSTGYNTGTTVLTDTLNESPFMSNVNIGYIPSSITLTEANVTAGVLALTSSAWNSIAATVATNITQINDGNKGNRQIMMVNNNAYAVFVKGTYMILASNFTGYGCIILQLRVIAGQTYAYELSRTLY